jgi:hypothetical protein
MNVILHLYMKAKTLMVITENTLKTANGGVFALLQFKTGEHLEVAAVYQRYQSNSYTQEPKINLWQAL